MKPLGMNAVGMTFDEARALMAREACNAVIARMGVTPDPTGVTVEQMQRATMIIRAGEQPPGHVYFIKRRSLVKIGFSVNPTSRIKTLELQAGQKVKIIGIFPGTVEDEHALHAKFKQHRVMGEWFLNEGELQAFMRAPKRSWREWSRTR